MENENGTDNAHGWSCSVPGFAISMIDIGWYSQSYLHPFLHNGQVDGSIYDHSLVTHTSTRYKPCCTIAHIQNQNLGVGGG